MLIFRKPIEGIDRPQMPADVVIVGGGPAGMACALRLSQLIDQHNAAHPDLQRNHIADDDRELLRCDRADAEQGRHAGGLYHRQHDTDSDFRGE